MSLPRESRAIGPRRALRSLRTVVTALAAAGLAAACADAAPEAPTSPEAPVGTIGAPQEFAAAVLAQERHAPGLLRIAGVVGAGVGVDEEGRAVVRVFTLGEGVEGIPGRLDGVPTDVLVTGMFLAGAANNPTTRERPAPNGFSVGHPDITAGTLGAAVTDGTDVYILSNNHVLANSNDASLGDAALQPGPFDGGTLADQIGTLGDFQPIDFSGGDNVIDAAIALVTNPADLVGETPSIADGGYGAPGTGPTVNAFVGQDVMKYGRTTRLTHGDVAETNATVNVCYETRGPFRCVKLARFVNQFTISPGSFSDGGDSGSLIVVDDNTRNPVGLLFAGSSTRTIANPIGAVFSRFGLSIETDPGDGGTPTNAPPTAGFTFETSGLTVDFTDTSADSDGTVVARSWDFGDGNTSTAQNPSHTYAAGGTYSVTLTVTDDDDATDEAMQDVAVSDGGSGEPGTTMHVADLAGSSTSNGSTWTANVTILIEDDQGNPVSGAGVSGSWSDGASGNAQCTTGVFGTCGVSVSGILKRTGSVRFTVTDVTDTLTYDSASNAETSVVVTKP